MESKLQRAAKKERKREEKVWSVSRVVKQERKDLAQSETLT